METEKKPLIILTGPTAVGKTDLSIALAKAVNGAVISADSMQVYRYMDIGSAKISKKEMQGVPHYLVDEFMPDEEFNVVKFQEYAKRYLKEHKKVVYITLLTSGRLNSYLADIEEQAQERFERIVDQMKQAQGITEQLKAENQMEWVVRMNNIQTCAREVVNAELIYN